MRGGSQIRCIDGILVEVDAAFDFLLAGVGALDGIGLEK